MKYIFSNMLLKLRHRWPSDLVTDDVWFSSSKRNFKFIWFFNLLTWRSRVPNDGYSRNASFAPNYISTVFFSFFLLWAWLVKGYYRKASYTLNWSKLDTDLRLYYCHYNYMWHVIDRHNRHYINVKLTFILEHM